MFDSDKLAGHGSKSLLVTGVVSLLIIYWLATLDFISSFFSSLSHPLILGVLRLFTSDVHADETAIHVGLLEVPWTRDCAGINLLLVLLAVTAWMNRHEPSYIKYFLRLTLMLPAAILANTARVLTLIAFRTLFFPVVESPQLHYFFGFLWLVPFSLLAIPTIRRSRIGMILELLHTATVISLLTPLMTTRGAWSLAAAIVLCLTHSSFPEKFSKQRIYFLFGWMFCALPLSWLGMSSLWLPWVMVCPLVVQLKWLKHPTSVLLILACCPIIHLNLIGQCFAWGIILFTTWQFFRSQPLSDQPEPVPLAPISFRRYLAYSIPALAFSMPFLGATLFSDSFSSTAPPAGIPHQKIQGMGYELRVDRQPSQLALVWYSPQGSDRHHSLETCLLYRGIELSDTGSPHVQTDGQHWFREFFLVDQKLIHTHLQYLRHTIGFRRSPGVHLIAVAPKTAFTLEGFNQTAIQTSETLLEKVLAETMH